jgi:hypothetical protein
MYDKETLDSLEQRGCLGHEKELNVNYLDYLRRCLVEEILRGLEMIQ